MLRALALQAICHYDFVSSSPSSVPAVLDPSFHIDNFAREHLPPADLWPAMAGGATYPRRMNAAAELLDRAVANGFADRPCLHTLSESWSYARLLETANRIARFLVEDFGLVAGNRVLLRAPNNPMLAACWLGVLKAGGVVVATMPLLRAPELAYALSKARIQFALCDARLAGELASACEGFPQVKTCLFGTDAPDGLEARIARNSAHFDNVILSHDDVALIAFTSGTTGPAKATAHFHRDLLAICDHFPAPLFDPKPDDVFAGSAPFAFTFGLGALLLFPLRFGASSVLLENATPETLLDVVIRRDVSILFTVPTLYRTMAPLVAGHALPRLRICVSSGEHLSAAMQQYWKDATGLTLLNSIGSTEMLHAFIAMRPGENRPGAAGRPLPGFQARIVDAQMREVAIGEVGRLAVRGPTGCRYLDDAERQKTYVRGGWNLTGDAFCADADGYFWYHARTDDMIVSAGYNISASEVEEVLLQHVAVRECAVVGTQDEARGQVVTAFVVLSEAARGSEDLTRALQDFVKSTIAPYKYPRVIRYLDTLPRTTSGKVQRNILREHQSSL
jgi:2-aminobenzoate-CoA ligase